MLPNGMDLAVLVIIGVFAFLGWRNGLVKMGIRLVSFGLALGCAWAFHPFLADALKKTKLYQSLFSSVVKNPQSGTGLPESLQNITARTGNAVAEHVTNLLLSGLSFFLILILARVLIFLLSKVLHFVAALPVIGLVNRLAGTMIGLVEGFLIVWILMAAMVILPPLRENKSLGYMVEQSVVARSLYQHNIILHAMVPENELSGQK